MMIPVSIPCNCFIVDNCTLHDSIENRTSLQNRSCKLVICLLFSHASVSVLSKRRISSSLWHFLTLYAAADEVCTICYALFTYLVYISFSKCVAVLHNDQLGNRLFFPDNDQH